MIRKRRVAGILSAIRVISCLAILALGPSVGRADELADLRASQVLLQRRLDQLAQVPSAGELYPGEPRSSATGIGGSFPRSFLIPGSDTSIRVGGDFRTSVTYFLNGANPNAVPATSNVTNAVIAAPLHVHNAAPVAGVFPLAGNAARSRSNNIVYLTPQQSRLIIETRTPSAWGQVRTYATLDWANGNAFVPGNNPLLSTNDLPARMHNAYATLGGLLAGQTSSNFGDPDADTFTLEFGGEVGDGGVTHIPQIRYTMPLTSWALPGAVSVSAEAPETDGWTPGSGIIGSDATAVAPATFFNPFKAPVPDLTTTWYIPQPWGHAQFSALLRPVLQIKDGQFVDRTYTGWGTHFSGDLMPGWFGWAKDDITWNAVYGDGIGRYLGGNFSMFALVTNYPAATPTSAAAAANVVARTTVGWSGNTGYTHWLRDDLRLRFGGGIVHHDIGTGPQVTAGGVAGTVTPTSAVCPSARLPAGAVGAGAALSGAGGCGLNKELVTANVNLLWNPVPFIDIGVTGSSSATSRATSAR
jgi:hypothetical protein